jgi:division protein CdvB (Snf7/Vps24/ESCRT-III family)
VTIPNALETVCKLRGVNFTKDGEASTGVIAQEVQKVIPEVVLQGDEYLSVAYGNLVGVLIEAVKELKAEVETLKKGQ